MMSLMIITAFHPLYHFSKHNPNPTTPSSQLPKPLPPHLQLPLEEPSNHGLPSQCNDAAGGCGEVGGSSNFHTLFWHHALFCKAINCGLEIKFQSFLMSGFKLIPMSIRLIRRFHFLILSFPLVTCYLFGELECLIMVTCWTMRSGILDLWNLVFVLQAKLDDGSFSLHTKN